MESRTLEINSISGKDLNKVNLITKMDVYAVVSISGGDKKTKQSTKTPVDRDGDANPTWNFPMKFTVDEAALQQNRLTLDFKLVCERALGNKDIGEVHVPIKELLESPTAGNHVKQQQQRFVSYQVRKPNGQPKGQITFSYKFLDKFHGAAAVAPPAAVAGFAKLEDEPVTAYPAVGSSFVYPPPSPSPSSGGLYPPLPVDHSTGSPSPSSGGLYPPLPVDHSTGQYPPPPSSHGAYPPPPSGYMYPPPPSSHEAYPPPPSGYMYPPPPSSYGQYPPPLPSPGYGYPPQRSDGAYPPVQRPQKKNNLGLGLGAGLLGGFLVGDMISDVGDGGFDGGFDF